MKHLAPTRIDWRDHRFAHAKLFGAVTDFPKEFHIEHQFSFQDQNEDNRPTACSAYTVCTVAGYQDNIRYSVDYQLMKTFELMNVPPNTEGADLRKAFKVPVAFGLLEADNEPPELMSATQAWAANQSNWPLSYDTQAAKNKNPAYIPVVPIGQDWFDAVRSAILGGQKAGETRAVGVGTRWSPDFEHPINGVLPSDAERFYWGHAYIVTGWKVIKGETLLELLTWQGKKYGLKGYAYITRDTFNKLMKEWGSYAATLQDVPTDTIVELKGRIATISEVIAMLTAALKNLYLTARYGLAH